MINTYKLGCVATTPGDVMTSIQLPRKGTIRQVQISVANILEADSYGTVQIAVNRGSGQFNTSVSSPANVLAEATVALYLTTSGISNAFANVVAPQNYPVNPRDTIYLHGIGVSLTSGLTVNVIVQVDEPEV